jgi:hypothetical protein
MSQPERQEVAIARRLLEEIKDDVKISHEISDLGTKFTKFSAQVTNINSEDLKAARPILLGLRYKVPVKENDPSIGKKDEEYFKKNPPSSAIKGIEYSPENNTLSLLLLGEHETFPHGDLSTSLAPKTCAQR